MTKTTNPMLDTAIIAAKKAGKIMRDNFNTGKVGQLKEDNSWFTEIDVKCEDAIREIILKKFPCHNILAEEKGAINNNSDITWVIDPLDGTHNFIYGIPLFGVSIAACKNNLPIVGVIYLPITDELYTAEKGKGAFLNGKNIHVSDNIILSNSLLIAGSSLRKERESRINKLKDFFITEFKDYRLIGCSVYELTLVAKGASDAKIGFHTNPWDIAAGFLIVEEAGGKVSDFKGKPWDINIKQHIVSNGKIHDQLLKIISK